MPLRTCLTGSYPPVYNPYELIHLLPQAQQDDLVHQSIDRAIHDQLELGLDILVDGQARADIVSLFAHNMPGFDPHSKSPTVIGKIRPGNDPLTVPDYCYAQSQCPGKPLKAHITGTFTLSRGINLNTDSYNGIDDLRLLNDLADALADEAAALVQAGAQIVQIDEPVLQDGFDLDLAFRLMDRLVQRARIPFPALHVCGDVTLILPDILERAPVCMVSIEGSWLDSPPLRYINDTVLTRVGKSIGLGCFNSTEKNVISADRLKRKLDFYVQRLGVQQIWAAMPNCGLRFTTYDLAYQKLQSMTQAARRI